MNKVIFAILFFLVFSCISQDSKDINIDTRKEIENWLNQKLNEPCYFMGSPYPTHQVHLENSIVISELCKKNIYDQRKRNAKTLC